MNILTFDQFFSFKSEKKKKKISNEFVKKKQTIAAINKLTPAI